MRVSPGDIVGVERRHEILRTCLDVRNGELVQVVYPDVPIEVRRTDLRGLPSGRRAVDG